MFKLQRPDTTGYMPLINQNSVPSHLHETEGWPSAPTHTVDVAARSKYFNKALNILPALSAPITPTKFEQLRRDYFKDKNMDAVSFGGFGIIRESKYLYAQGHQIKGTLIAFAGIAAAHAGVAAIGASMGTVMAAHSAYARAKSQPKVFAQKVESKALENAVRSLISEIQAMRDCLPYLHGCNEITSANFAPFARQVRETLAAQVLKNTKAQGRPSKNVREAQGDLEIALTQCQNLLTQLDYSTASSG